MNAVLAIISDGGQGIADIDREVGRNKLITRLIHDIILNPWMAASANPFHRGSQRGGVCLPDKTMLLEGQTAPSWWGCMCLCFLLAKSLPNESFLFPPERT
jgi:hypothetical protein